MRIFEGKNPSLTEPPYPELKDESELHNTVEKNIGLFFQDLELVKHEFEVDEHNTIDTFAYDRKHKMFAIIEFKRGKNDLMFLQVDRYDNAVKKNKRACLWELSQALGLNKEAVKWNNTRMIHVKEDFSPEEIKYSLDKKRIELCVVRKYRGGWLVHHLGNEPKHRPRRHTTSSVDPPRTGSKTKQYLEADWLAGKYGGPKIPVSTQNLYFDLKNAIREMFPQIKHVQKKLYAKFYLKGGKTVFTVECFKHKLDLVYATNNVDLLPINDFVEDVSKVGHHGPGKHRSQLRQQPEVSRALEYVELMYRQQGGGRTTKAKGADKQNDSPNNAYVPSAYRLASDAIDHILRDDKEHKTREIRDHLYKTLEKLGIVIPTLRLDNAVNSKLYSLKKAGKIASVGSSTYKRV